MTNLKSISDERTLRKSKALPKKVREIGMSAGVELPKARVLRLYRAEGGPLVGWLFDEARRRQQDYKTMASEVGVTFGYINQLRNGSRSVAQISQAFAEACSSYLGVPTIVVKIVSGKISTSDFVAKSENEEELIERAIRQIQDDVMVRQAVPQNLSALSLDAKRALILMYGETSGNDPLNFARLPEMVRWLKGAVVLHGESEFAALHGHRAVVNCDN